MVDITPTGVLRDDGDHEQQRNQQRNWESLLQIMSLRTQPMNVVPPTKHTDGWHFAFEVEAEGVLGSNFGSDELDGLVGDCEGVPMVTGLDEAEVVAATLHARGANQNIWFSAINTPLEPDHG